MLTSNQLRQKYFDFFSDKTRKHVVIPSSSLVPENDPTTLFTGSGMQPLIEYFLGEPHPKGTRVVDSQKCFRSQDIEEVGDNRHTTFFEMMGNWSFGDYFKEEQIPWVFEFLTKEVGLDPKRIFVTVFQGSPDLDIPRDEKSAQLWKDLFEEVGVNSKIVHNSEEKGMQDGRIFYYGFDNWWSRSGEPKNMPANEPGGPDSEVFYDYGEELGLHEASEFENMSCHVNCDCGRFLEIGNSVFMQYQKQADGSFTELPNKNVDFGGGFERILAASGNEMDIFKTDLFTTIITHLEKLSGSSYEESEEIKQSFRVIADHIKAAVMLAADGVFPSNKEQGYFSRRLVRRAIRYGKMIGIQEDFLGDLVPVVVEIYKDAYPKVAKKQQEISEVLVSEEKKFRRTLERGLREFEKRYINSALINKGLKTIMGLSKEMKVSDLRFSADFAFKMYESHGFPLEMSIEEANRKNFPVEENIQEKFNKLKLSHAEKSRTASAGQFKGGLKEHSEATTKYHTATHLLHAALRKILGNHVQQKGSNITAEKLRFDFSHPQALTQEEKQKVQDQINEWIKQDLPMTKKIMPKQEALNQGAMAFFVEKYPDEVSVYTVGNNPDGDKDWISKELCGGPHVARTSEIGEIVIYKEKAASAGVRRVYARFG